MKISKEDIANIYPCTPVQEGMFSSWQINPESASYFIQTTFMVRGTIDPALFEKSFGRLLAKHDVLRTIFRQISGHKALQLVLKNPQSQFEYFDLDGGTDQQVQELLEADRKAPFDLSNQTPLRLKLIKTAAHTHTIVWTHHHILMEGWCFFMLMKDFLQIYHALSNGDPVVEESLPGFSSYVQWLGKQDKSVSGNYWSAYLDEYQDGLKVFPINHGKRSTSYVFGSQETKVTRSEFDKIEDLCGKWGCTINQLVGVLWAHLLFQYNKCRDVVYGMVISVRPEEIQGNEKIIGNFLNTIPVRINAIEDPRVKDLVLKVREDFANAYEHRYYSLADTHQQLGFQVVNHILTFENYPDMENSRETERLGWTVEDLEVFEPSDYDINLVVQTEDGLALRIDYNQKIYSDKKVAELLQSFGRMVSNFLAKPTVKTSDLIEEHVGKTLEKQYWENTLTGGDPQVPELVGTGTAGGTGSVLQPLGIATSTKLRQISAGSQERVQVLLYASLLALLRKYTGHSDLLLASPIFNQSEAEGEFINKVMCLRTIFSGEDTFQTLAGRAGKTIQEAVRHQNYPIELISRILNPQNEAQGVLDANFTVVISIDGLHLKGAIDVLNPQLHFYFKEEGDQLLLELLYDVECFSETYVKGIAENYATFTSQLLDNASVPLKAVGLQQHEAITARYGARQGYKHQRVDDWLDASFKEFSDSLAIEMGAESLTYAALDQKSRQVASYLREQGLTEGDMVGLCVKRSPAAIVALIGIIRARGAFVPLDAGIPVQRLQFIVDQTKAKFLIVDQPWDIEDLQQLYLADMVNERNPVEEFELKGDASSLCYTLFTSGTTGTSKGCMISQRSLVNYIQWVHKAYLSCLDNRPFFGWYTTLAFDFTLTTIFGALTSGGRIRIYDEEQNIGTILLDLFQVETNINIVKLTPSHISVLSHLELSASNVQVAICGGEALTVNNIQTLSHLSSDIKIFNEYGPTEATVGCIVSDVGHKEESISIGAPIDNSGACIIDLDGLMLPDDVVGELVLAGDNLMNGYLNGAGNERIFHLPSSTSSERFYKTGDLGYFDSGSFYCMGRADEEFKLRGYRIHPSEVTAALDRFDGVSSSFVMKVNEEVGDLLVGYLVSSQDIDINEVKAFAGQYLPEYMIPAHLFVVDELPLKPSGKIDSKRLPSYEVWKRSGVNYTAPANSVESKLVEIWQEVMGREQVGIFDNFFMIGGHSLHATQIVTRIKRDLTNAVDFRALYSYPSIDKLSVHIARLMESESDTSNDSQGISPVEDSPDYPLSHAQQRLWIIEQLDSTRQGYLTAGLYEINGILDLEALRKTFAFLVARHEVLRTRFFKGAGVARQEVLSPQESGFRLLEEPYTTDEQTVSRLEEILHEPFDLTTGSPMRVVVSMVGEPRAYLGICFHHIVCDGWSMNVVLADIKKLYEAYSQGKKPNLPSLNVQYRDFVIWEKNKLEKEGEQLKRKWLKHLEGADENLELPLDYPRPAKRGFSGGYLESETALAPLKDYSIELGVGMYSLLMSSIKMLLHSLTGSQHITVGTAVTGRDQIELENQVGLYVNTLPFHTQLDTGMVLEEFISQEHHRLLNMLEYQNYPFDRILEDLDYQALPNRNPLFDTGFTWHANTFELASFSKDLKLREIPLSMGSSKADLWFHGAIEKNILKLSVEFDKDIFQTETAELILYKWSSLLQVLRQLAESTIGEIDLEYKNEKPSVSKIEFDF